MSLFPPAVVSPADVVVEVRTDGTIRARSPRSLGPYPTKLSERLETWAAVAPDRPFVVMRDQPGAWARLTYADTLRRVRHVAQALVDRGLSRDRTIIILSGNSLDHAVVALAAMYVGVPYAPVAPAYSIGVQQHTALRAIVASMRPGLVFAADGPLFERALTAIAAPGIEIVTATAPATLGTTRLSDLDATPVTGRVDDAHAQISPDTIAKILFTSGSTGRPKGVINTQRMICANQEQILATLPCLGERPPTLCDWLPWNHTFGGNHNFGLVLYNGGTLYIDGGRPGPDTMATTIANLRDVATTAYFNVPRGYEMLLPHLRADDVFRAHFFSELRLLFYAAAGLRREIADAFQELAVATLGHPVPWVTGFGATETAPMAMSTGPQLSVGGHVGVPVPGLELKATPVNSDGDLEARVKGPNITPGYWNDDALTQAAFDDEGFYRLGDVIAPIDRDDWSRGFRFDRRLDEDFKLSTGTWVRVGAVRARLLASVGDLAQDVVVAGHDREDVRILIFPYLLACRALAGLDREPPAAVLADTRVRAAVAERLAAYNADCAGSSTAVTRAVLLDVPPSIDAMEITDKGSLNQRAVLKHRADVVDALYRSDGSGILC